MMIDMQLMTAKIETVYGIDSAPTAAANSILAQNVKYEAMNATQVEREYTRNIQGARPSILVGKTTKITFEAEFKGSGTPGDPPAYGVFLRACKCAETIAAGVSVTYNPVSSNHQSVSIYFHLDGILFKMIGARGSWKLKLNALGIPVIEFTMVGLFTQPTALAVPTPTYATQVTVNPQPATTATTPTFTVGGYSAVLRNFNFDAGNDVKYRGLIRSESVIITGSSEKADFQIEAVPLATFNPFSLAEAGTTQAVTLAHGTGAGKVLTLSIPAFQLLSSAMTDVDKVVEYQVSGKCLPFTFGNDQFTLTQA